MYTITATDDQKVMTHTFTVNGVAEAARHYSPAGEDTEVEEAEVEEAEVTEFTGQDHHGGTETRRHGDERRNPTFTGHRRNAGGKRTRRSDLPRRASRGGRVGGIAQTNSSGSSGRSFVRSHRPSHTRPEAGRQIRRRVLRSSP